MAYSTGTKRDWHLNSFIDDFIDFADLSEDEVFTFECQVENAEIDLRSENKSGSQIFKEGYYYIASRHEGDKGDPVPTHEEDYLYVTENLYNQINEYIES